MFDNTNHPLWKDFVAWYDKDYHVWYSDPLTHKDLFAAYIAGAKKGSEVTMERMLREREEIQQARVM